MIAANPYQQYKEQSLSTMAPGELLVKLYDELIKQMRIAVLGLERKDFGSVNDSLNKCQTILGTLDSSLNMSYDISQNLRDLYVFMAKQLMDANMKKVAKPINELIPLVRDLRDSFDQAEKSVRKQQRTPVGGKAV